MLTTKTAVINEQLAAARQSRMRGRPAFFDRQWMYNACVPRRVHRAPRAKSDAATRMPRRPRGRPAVLAEVVGPDAIIAATDALLRELPPAKVTRAAVARRAGVDPGLIRYYFKDRGSLLLAVLRRAVELHRREVSEALENAAETKAAEQLRNQVLRFVQFNFAHPYLYRLLVEEIAQSDHPEGQAYFQEITHGAIAYYNRLLKAGQKDGSLRKTDPVMLHIALIGMSEFFCEAAASILESHGKRDSSPQNHARRYAEMIAGLVIDGLATR